MWKKLRELEVGTVFHLTTDPSGGRFEIREVRENGLLISSGGSRPERWKVWGWEEVEENDLVWVEDSTE